jgi:dTDP-4-dehydrorhamnose reductase
MFMIIQISQLKKILKIKPSSFYGKTKLLAEKKILNKKYRYHKYFIARIFSVYHKNQKKPFLYPSIKDKLK